MKKITTKVKGIKIRGIALAYDDCHKIYIINKKGEILEALENGYIIYPMDTLKYIYNNSCSLRFINSWDLKKTYIRQGF